MRFFKTSEFGLLVCFALIIVLFSSALYTVQQTPSNLKTRTYNEANQSKDFEPRKERSFNEALASDPVAYYTRLLFIATFVLAAFTFALAIVTVLIWVDGKEVAAKQQIAARRALMHAVRSARASEKAIEASNLSSERQLRAYLSITRVSYSGLYAEEARFEVEYTNCGKTPAYNIEHWIIVSLIKKESQATFVFGESLSEGRGNMGDCGPSAVCTVPQTGPRKLTIEEITSVKIGQAGIFFWGAFYYTDAFGIKRESLFRNSINNPGGLLSGSGSMGVCHQGNRTT